MVELKVTTEYSMLKSLIKVQSLIDFLIAHNIKECGICDDELFGVMEFYNACINNNIKPIIGLKIIVNNKEICLYPKNYLGYQKLLKINSLKFKKELEINDFEDNNILIVLPYQSIDLFDNFNIKENVYLGYQNDNEKRNILLVSENIVYFHDVRCLNKDDIKYLKYLEMLGEEFNYNNDNYYKLNISEDDEKYLNKFTSQIDIKLTFNERFIPIYNKKIDSYKYLTKLAKTGLNKRLNGNVTSEYTKRLNEELMVVNKMGFTNYFLIVYDYVLYAKKNNILVGPGRGSAAGSLISYAIGITDIDPIKYNLLFARFLNPYRKKMPDIDIDFEDTKRMDVINYVKEKYGEDKVALGITFNSLKSKLVLRDLAKVLKINNNLLEKFIKEITAYKSLKDNLENLNVKKYLKLYPELDNLYNIALHLEGLKKNISTHAAGVVISSNTLDEIIPVYDDGDFLKTGIAMEYLESLGLLKMDFLALRNLSIIGKVTSKINNFKITDINIEDAKVYELFKNANTDDIFQFESRYAKNNLLKLDVSSFEELAIAIALVRPGPSNQIDEYVKRKKTGHYNIHPDLKDILASTKGIIIFQEQVMKILEVIGGYTSYEADSIRIAISKKKEDIILGEETKFINNAIKKGYDKEFAEDLFKQIKRFAEYGFNKAHAVSYALIAYQMTYLKTYYPLEFNITLLEMNHDEKSKKRLFNDLKKRDIKLLKPNINVSTLDYQFKKNNLLLPLGSVKGISLNIWEDILHKRNKSFKDIFSFFIKCQDILNDKNYEIFVKSGLLDCFGYNKKTLIENSEVLFNYAFLNNEEGEKPLLEKYEEYDDNMLRSFEIDYYGFYISNHPCSIYQKVVKVENTKKYLFKNINMALLVEKINNIKTKKGEDMAFINASDETGNIELTIFPDKYKMIQNIKINDIIIINGKSSKRFDEYGIIVNKIERK